MEGWASIILVVKITFSSTLAWMGMVIHDKFKAIHTNSLDMSCPLFDMFLYMLKNLSKVFQVSEFNRPNLQHKEWLQQVYLGEKLGGSMRMHGWCVGKSGTSILVVEAAISYCLGQNEPVDWWKIHHAHSCPFTTTLFKVLNKLPKVPCLKVNFRTTVLVVGTTISGRFGLNGHDDRWKVHHPQLGPFTMIHPLYHMFP